MYTIGSRAFNSPAVSTYGGALVDGIPDEYLSGGIAAPPNLDTWDNVLRMRAHLGEKKRTIGLAKAEIALQKAIAARIRAAEDAGDWGLIEARRDAAKEVSSRFIPGISRAEAVFGAFCPFGRETLYSTLTSG